MIHLYKILEKQMCNNIKQNTGCLGKGRGGVKFMGE